jgi:hypothetical protein
MTVLHARNSLDKPASAGEGISSLPKPDLLKRWGTAFADGLLQSSLLSLSVAALVCLGVIAAAALLITERAMSGPDSALFAQDALDDYAFATSDALRLLHDPPRTPHLALIGTAAMREALTADDEIARRLGQGLGRSLPVIDFMSGGQSGIEMAALAESLGRDFQGVVVLGISFSRLAADSSELAGLVREPRLAFASDAGDAEIRAAGFRPARRTGLYLLDHYKFFVARYRLILWHLLTGQRPVHATRTYLGRPPANIAQWTSDATILKTRLAHYDERADNNLGAMRRLIRMFPDHSKVRIVLLEIPLNPKAMQEVTGPDFVARHRARMQSFAQQEGVLYWDLNQSAGLAEADFQDWAHINSAAAQDRWTAQLVERLLPLFATP